MIISNELFQSLCIIDNDTAKHIATTFKSKTNEMISTGYILEEAFNDGYLKGSDLVIKLLLSDTNTKEDTLKQINGMDLSEYLHYSCKSNFNRGFTQAINQLNLEIENINKNKL